MTRKLRALVACECSGRVRDALLQLGFDAWSCDVKPSEVPGPHYKCDVRDVLYEPWDLLIAHPECRYMSNAGVRWLHSDASRWPKLFEGAEFFKLLLCADHIPYRAVENSVMHKYALQLIGRGPDQIVQPHWFGDPHSKAAAWWLHGLPRLERTHQLTPPAKNSPEYKAWHQCWFAQPGPERAALRARTHLKTARAYAEQWGRAVQREIQI